MTFKRVSPLSVTTAGSTDIHYTLSGKADGLVFLWAHGWGQSHKAFEPLASSFFAMGRHILIDFPGFGDSPLPPEIWGTADYADAMADFLRQHTDRPVIWIGHSFGCRVGIQLAARHPDLVKGMFLIAAAGLKRKRSFLAALSLKLRIVIYKALKLLIPLGLPKEKLLARFGSRDYAKADPKLRQILVKTVNEDLSEQAKAVTCPVMLVYGSQDTETPPEIGERLQKLIAGAELLLLDGQDHYTVLGDGRYPVAAALKKFIEKVSAGHAG